MKVYSRRRKLEILEMLETMLQKGDVLYLDEVKCLVGKDNVADEKYIIVDDSDVFPFKTFFEMYKKSEVLTELFTDVSVKSKSDNISAFFEKFFN